VGRPLGASDTFAALKKLNSPGDVEGTFERLGKILAPSGFHGTVSVQLVDETAGKQKTSHFTLTLADGKAKVSDEPAEKPDVEFITTAETWQEIAAGKLEPQDAFFGGRMRLRGKAELAREMFHSLLNRATHPHTRKEGT
jgi:hypothetical protein